jgi:hypothetical protein
VEVAGSGLRGSGLLEFMEGSQKFVLLVRGPAPPAPLARLASPGVFVAQATGAEGLDAIGRLAHHDGPGVVGIFEEGAGALLFSHGPDGDLEVDEVELKASAERAEAKVGKPGLLDLRYLAGLVAVASVRAAAAAAAASGPAGGEGETVLGSSAAPDAVGLGDGGVGDVAPAGSALGDPAVDQLADWLLARTHPSTD